MLGSLERQAIHQRRGRGDFSFARAWGTPNAQLPLRPGPGLLGHSCRQYLNLPAWGYLRSIYCVLKRMIYHFRVFSVWLVSAMQTGVKVGCLLALCADHTMPTSPGRCTEMPCVEHRLWNLSQGHFFLTLSLFYHIVFLFMVISLFFSCFRLEELLPQEGCWQISCLSELIFLASSANHKKTDKQHLSLWYPIPKLQINQHSTWGS